MFCYRCAIKTASPVSVSLLYDFSSGIRGGVAAVVHAHRTARRPFPRSPASVAMATRSPKTDEAPRAKSPAPGCASLFTASR